MKKIKCHILLVSLIFGGITPCISQEPDTLIQKLVGQISDSLYTNSVQRLQDFNTRYELSDSIGPAGQWIYDQFIGYGYTDVVFDSFTWTPTVGDTPIVSRNILATKPGFPASDSLVILGAHYDSINDWLSEEDPNAPAPGANDNATGVAGVLEIARLLEPYSFEKTIVFACFAGEEVGFGGSSDYVSKLYFQGTPVRLSLVFDELGYQRIHTQFPVVVDGIIDYLDDALRTAQLGLLYSRKLDPYIAFGYYGSDHRILELVGPALLIIEELRFPPGVHTEFDLIDSLSMEYATEILKMGLASIADVAKFDVVGIRSSDEKSDTHIPRTIILNQNYPNPFNPTTTISFDIPGEAGEKQHVKLNIYDLRGRHVKTLIDSELEPGSHKVVWDGRTEHGNTVSSGVYIYNITSNNTSYSRKMIMLK